MLTALLLALDTRVLPRTNLFGFDMAHTQANTILAPFH